MNFPDFNIGGFPYQNLPQQLTASMQARAPQTYGRWGGAMQMPTQSGGGLLNFPQMPDNGNTNYTPGLPGLVANGNQWSAPGPVPTTFNGTGTAPFAASWTQSPSIQRALTATPTNAVAAARQAHMRQAYSNMPSSYTVSGFNQTAKTDPKAAARMLANSQQDFRNAIMQANGWSNMDMNQFINQYSLGGGLYG